MENDNELEFTGFSKELSEAITKSLNDIVRTQATRLLNEIVYDIIKDHFNRKECPIAEWLYADLCPKLDELLTTQDETATLRKA